MLFYFLFYCDPHEAQKLHYRGQLLLLNLLRNRCFCGRGQLPLVILLRHRCCSVEVFYFVLIMRWKTETVPDVWLIVLANIAIKGRVIDSDVYSFFNGPGHILTLLAYYFEVFQCCCVASNILMFKK